MPHPKTVHCCICGGHVSEVGELSTRKRCHSCALDRMISAAFDISNRSGEHYEAWVLGTIAHAAKLGSTLRSSAESAEDAPDGLAAELAAMLDA